MPTYDTFSQPYDAYMNRSTQVSASEGAAKIDTAGSSARPKSSGGGVETATNLQPLLSSQMNGNTETMPVKSNGSLNDLWIDTFIKSTNWKPRTQGFWLDGPTGYAEFVNVYVSGNINATTGRIGGFIIDQTSLYGGIIKTAATVGLGTTGVIMDTNGLRGYDSVLGNTFNIPTDGSAPTFSSGIINSTVFNINTNSILRTSSTVGDGSASSAGILIDNTGFYATESNQTLSNANVKILVDGSATIKMNVKGGQTDFNTGIGYFLGLSGGQYKLSIGDPSSSYLTWDGGFLRIKGSLDVGNSGLINNGVYTVATLPSVPTTVGFNPPSAYE